MATASDGEEGRLVGADVKALKMKIDEDIINLRTEFNTKLTSRGQRTSDTENEVGTREAQHFQCSMAADAAEHHPDAGAVERPLEGDKTKTIWTSSARSQA